MKLKLGQIADWIHAEGTFDAQVEASGYSIDSRTIAAGDLFFAVTGERVNGHDYVETALVDGAAAAVVSMRWLSPPGVDEAKLLRVPDEDADCVLASMQTLAREVRRTWGKRVIGVTGSAGKTTTKECIAAVLATKYNVLKTEGNLNNHFGVPLTLLRLKPEHDVLVLEMGMNHAGEIRALAKIAEPDWGVVSNVAAVHLEHFADGIEGIARAKYELVESLPADGLAFLNADDERVKKFGKEMGARAVLYGTSAEAQFRAVDLKDGGLSGTEFTFVRGAAKWKVALRMPGSHHVLNALTALAVGWASDVDAHAAVRALEGLRPTEKRGNMLRWHGAELVDDTYNSNPKALLSMIDALAATPANRRILVAGEMLELGPETVTLHRECGQAAAAAGIDMVLGVRGLAREIVVAAEEKGCNAAFVETPEIAGGWMREHLREGDVVLLKASRGVRLERALEMMKQN